MGVIKNISGILIFLLTVSGLYSADTVIWQENFDYNSTTELTNVWGPGIYRVTTVPFNGIAAARNKINFGTYSYVIEKRNGDLGYFSPPENWIGANEIQMWIQVTNYPSSVSTNVRIMFRLYNNATASKITNEHFILTNIELKKWRLISFPTNKISQYLNAVTNIAIYYRRGNTDSDTEKIGMYYDDLKVGKIAPIFLNSFSPDSDNGSVSSVTNLDASNNYTNNMTVRLRIDVGEIKFPNTITADFSGVDSAFNSANVKIITNKYRDYINGVYDVQYKISSANTIWGLNKTVKIIAIDRFGNGPVTNDSFKLNIFTGLPLQPVLISPADSSAITTLTPVFNWNASTNSYSYQLQISSSANFSSYVLSTNVSSTNYQINSGYLTEETKYFWRVRGKNYFGYGSWSTTNNFTTPQKILLNTNIIVNYFTNISFTDEHNSVFYFPAQCYSAAENLTVNIESLDLTDPDFITGYYLKPENIIFDKDIIIKFYVSPSQLPAGKNINDVVVKYYTGSEWIIVNSTVENNYIIIHTAIIGKFALYIGSPVSEDLKSVKLSSKIFSPNNDGDNDVLKFNIESKLSRDEIKIYIYDIYGNLIKELSGNTPVWTGDSDIGILKSGLYLYKVQAGEKINTGSFIVVK